jgi:hypothetical protein
MPKKEVKKVLMKYEACCLLKWNEICSFTCHFLQEILEIIEAKMDQDPTKDDVCSLYELLRNVHLKL